MEVYKLTIAQYKQIKNKQFDEKCFFNPIQDKNGNYIITIDEVDMAIENNSDIDFLKDLPLIEFEPKENPMPIIEK